MILAELDDQQLCAAVRDGDTAAFELLYRRHAGWVREAIARRIGAAEADDVVADTFAALLSALRRGRGPEGPVGPYLTTALRHRISRHLEATDRLVLTGDLIDVLEPEMSVVRTAPSVEETVLAEDDGATASAAFEALRPRDRRVLELVELRGLSYREAAAELDVSVANLGHMLHTARKALYDSWLAQHIAGSGQDHPHAFDLARYVTGTAGARIRHRVGRHLDTCVSCGLRIGELDDRAPRSARRASALGLLALLPVWHRLWSRGRELRGAALWFGRPPVELLVPVIGAMVAAGLLTGLPQATTAEPSAPVSAPGVTRAASGQTPTPTPATVTVAWEPGSTLAGVGAGETATLRFRITASGDRSSAVSLRITAGPGVSLDPGYRSCTQNGATLTCSWIGPLQDGDELVGQIVVRVDDPAAASLPTLSVG